MKLNQNGRNSKNLMDNMNSIKKDEVSKRTPLAELTKVNGVVRANSSTSLCKPITMSASKRKLEVYRDEPVAKRPKLIEQRFKFEGNISDVSEYSSDIFRNLFKSEEKTIPTHNYLLDNSSEYYLRSSMRSILVDWLVDVHANFKCLPETLLLAINIMDRFLSSNKVPVSKLQLVAVTSLFIACKYEEVKLPKITNFAYITDGAATVEDIRQAEINMLENLRFNINWPNPLNFLRRLSKLDDYNYELRDIAKFVLEFIMCTHYFVDCKPSFISAMAVYLSKQICDGAFNEDVNAIRWTERHTELSGGIDPDNNTKFKDSLQTIINEFRSPSSNTKSLLNKYKSKNRYGMLFRVQDWCLNYS